MARKCCAIKFSKKLCPNFVRLTLKRFRARAKILINNELARVCIQVVFLFPVKHFVSCDSSKVRESFRKILKNTCIAFRFRQWIFLIPSSKKNCRLYGTVSEKFCRIKIPKILLLRLNLIKRFSTSIFISDSIDYKMI